MKIMSFVYSSVAYLIIYGLFYVLSKGDDLRMSVFILSFLLFNTLLNDLEDSLK